MPPGKWSGVRPFDENICGAMTNTLHLPPSMHVDLGHNACLPTDATAGAGKCTRREAAALSWIVWAQSYGQYHRSLARNQGACAAGPRPPSPREGAFDVSRAELRWEGVRDKVPRTSGVCARPREGAALVFGGESG